MISMNDINMNENIIKKENSIKDLEQDRVLDVAVQAGNILLENGAEISRVEDTMARICEHFGIDSANAFVLTNGIFLTAGGVGDRRYAAVKYIPVKGTRFDKIVAVNQISRELVSGECTIQEAEKRLEEADSMPGKSPLTLITASGLSSAAFCIMFGGTFIDALSALIVGIILYLYVIAVSRFKISKLMLNITGGMIVTLLCYMLVDLNVGQHLHQIIIGAIMPLIPGVNFVNSIRDFVNEDYLSGAVRLLDAILVFVSISIGVGIVTMFIYAATGGKML